MCNSLKTAIDSASDVDAVAALYNNADGIDPATLQLMEVQTSVVNTTSNTITKNGHGLSNDELVLMFWC